MPRPGPLLVQTESAGSGGPVTIAHRSASYYDVQLGITFTQSFAYLAYNVTAVAQSDANGFGPGYLLNGLSNQGYWYQVGISWNWPNANGGHNSGFSLNYEVFDSGGNSVFPASGGGGLATLSGAVNEGDIVLLSLSFSGGNVVMYAFDWNTSASAQEAYTAHGATTFVGQTGGPDNGNGLFTGLMTEWWHSTASIGTISPVIYTNSTTALSSGWLWADDWDPNTGATIFSDYLYLAFSNPSQLQYFSTNGTTMAAKGYEFISGAVPAVSEVPVTFSTSVLGGGVGYSSPTLTYVSDGNTLTATLGSAPQSYSLDLGSTWSVNASLPGSGPTERWSTSETTSGTASATQTISFTYHHQYYLNVTSTYGSPTGTGWYNASSTADFQISTPQAGITGVQYAYPVWTGAGAGSYSGTNNPGSVTMNDAINESASTWTTQYYLTVTSSYGPPQGAGWYNASASASFGVTTPAAGGTGTQYVFSSWSGSYSGSNNPGYVVLAGPVSESASWKTQYYVTVTSEYGSVAGAGWYDSGSAASFSLSPSSVPAGLLTYHVFTGWSGDSTARSSTASVTVDSPKTITATWAVDSTQLYLAVAAIAIVIVAVLGVILIRRRRRPSPSQASQAPVAPAPPSPPSEPASPPSTCVPLTTA